MKVDTRPPVFVFVGAWNPAIFQSAWIARYLFNVPAGREQPATEVLVTIPIPRRIIYIENIGIAVSNERVEIFANDFDEAVIQRTEEVALRLVETLSHTPYGPWGVNFNFIELEPSVELLDALKTRDNIEQHFKIVSQDLVSAIKISDEVILNFSRHPSEKNVIFDFNYTHRPLVAKSAKDVLTGAIKKYLQQSEQILEKLYALKGYEVIKHDLGKPVMSEAKRDAI